MPGSIRLFFLAWAFGAVVAWTDRAAGGADRPVSAGLDVLAEAAIDSLVTEARLQAENTLLDQERERLERLTRGEPGRGTGPADLTRLEEETREAVAAMLHQASGPLIDGLDAALIDYQAQTDQLRQEWTKVRVARNQARLELARAAAANRAGRSWANLLALDRPRFWFAAMLAGTSLAMVVLHQRRHPLRRWAWGSTTGRVAWTALLLVPLALALVAARGLLIADASASPQAQETTPAQAISVRRELLAENRIIEARLAKLQRERLDAQRGHQAALVRWEAGADGLARGLLARALEHRRLLRELVGELAAIEAIRSGLDDDLDTLGQLNDQLALETRTALNHLRLQPLLRGGLGLALLGLVGWGCWAFQQRERLRNRETRATCPRCLARGALQPAPAMAVGDGLPGISAEEGTTAAVECQSFISRQPPETCRYVFPEAYQLLAKLCLPTLGVPQAGKTHWLAMLYWETLHRRWPARMRLAGVPSRAGLESERTIEELLETRLGTTATQRDRIPHPLVLHATDRDRLGSTSVLVNLFDYSGEVTTHLEIDDPRRWRALEADGYFFFLDPTFPWSVQAEALQRWCDDVREFWQLAPGRRLARPLALCFSKIDLLGRPVHGTGDNPSAAAEFYTKLTAIDPSGQSLTRRVIAARSRLVADYCRTLWPDWDIARQVREVFGTRCCFFPLTPVGLDDRGETDLSLRAIEPFGLVEPLAWMLHMNGYPQLPHW